MRDSDILGELMSPEQRRDREEAERTAIADALGRKTERDRQRGELEEPRRSLRSSNEQELCQGRDLR